MKDTVDVLRLTIFVMTCLIFVVALKIPTSSVWHVEL